MSEEVDIEKLRSINANIKAKGSKKVTVMDERGSTQIEHWDDRVDANIMAPAIQVSTKIHKDI